MLGHEEGRAPLPRGEEGNFGGTREGGGAEKEAMETIPSRREAKGIVARKMRSEGGG